MTIVSMARNRKHLMGLSGDSKPTTDIPIGSDLWEVDTGLRYAWDGATWQVVGRSDAGGASRVSLYTQGSVSGDTAVRASTSSVDGFSDSRAKLEVLGENMLFNGTSWDRSRNNQELAYASLIPSAARTASGDFGPFRNYNGRGILLLMDVTANPGGAETLTVSILASIQSIQKVAWAWAALPAAANNNYLLVGYPGILQADMGAQAEANAILPATFYVRVTHSSTGSWTYRAAAQIML